MSNHRFETNLDVPPYCRLIAVDLGYSSSRKSCGLACSWDSRAEEYQFGQAIRETAKLIQSDATDVVLGLEAVLSTKHDESGNPAIRGEFERGRLWYCQPGVVTFAAALRFLDELRKELPPSPRVIVAEAFLSNKPERTSHADDAQRIVRAFWQVDAEESLEGLQAASPHVKDVPSIRVL